MQTPDASGAVQRVAERRLVLAAGRAETQIDQVHSGARCPVQGAHQRRGGGGETIREDPHGEQLRVGRFLANHRRHRGAVPQAVGVIRVFPLFGDRHASGHRTDMRVRRVHPAVDDRDPHAASAAGTVS